MRKTHLHVFREPWQPCTLEIDALKSSTEHENESRFGVDDDIVCAAAVTYIALPLDNDAELLSPILAFEYAHAVLTYLSIE